MSISMEGGGGGGCMCVWFFFFFLGGGKRAGPLVDRAPASNQDSQGSASDQAVLSSTGWIMWQVET